MNTLMIAFNLTVADPVKRQVFNSRDFRIGMSCAIDRRDIVKAIYQRQGRLPTAGQAMAGRTP